MFIGGSEGLFAQKTLEITDDILQTYKNQGTLFAENSLSWYTENLVHYLILINLAMKCMF